MATEMVMTRKQALLIIFCAVAILLFFALDLGRFFTLTSLKSNHQALLVFYSNHRLVMVGGFMVIYIVQTALSLPGAAILSLAAGAIFGTMMGTLYAVISASIGAILAFLATRYILRDAVISRFGGRLERMNAELDQRGLNYLLFLRLVPIFPFFLINLAAGITRLPLRTFAIGTMAGIIPGAFVYVNAGASLATINSLREIASLRVLGAFALLGIFALLPVIYQKIATKGE
jgi:uncharacterized membrane protein YdjX (TVP38/TMEM64 family)